VGVPQNSTETDENGRFQLSRLEREDEGYLVAQAKGYAAAVQSATPGRGEKVPRLSFKLSPGASATGRVVDSEGRPVARAMVVAQLLSTTLMPHRVGLGPYLKTDKDGRFKIDGLPSGHVTVNVWAEGYSTVEERPLKLDAENTIVLDPVGVIIGKVADEITGQPVSEFRVLRTRSSASPWSEPKAVIRGDSRYYDQGGDLFRSNDGTFTLKDLVCRASHAVVVSAPGYAPTHLDPVAAQAPDWKDWPLVIKLNKGATVSGQVLDAESGQPVADAEVCLFAQQLGRPLMGRFSLAAIERPSFYQFTAVRKGRTDQAGRYELPVIPKDGVLYLVARASGYGPSLQQDIEFEKPSVIKLARAGSIAGTAAGVPNLDLKKARVHAEGVGFNFESVKVGDDGAFRLDNLPPGDFWLTLRTDDWKYRRMNRVEVLSGQTTQVDWGRLPSFKLTGTATQAGKPVAGVKVNVNCAEDGHPMGHLATTDAQGRYVFPNLSPGEYLVSTWKGEGWPRSHEAREEIVIRDKDTELNFDFPAARIVGRVLDGATGQPLKDVTVSALRLLPPDAPPERSITLGMMDSGEYVLSISPLGRRKPGQLDLTNVQALAAQRTAGSDFSARTEANGEFEIANLAAGTYLLRLNTPDDSIPIVVHGVVLAHDRETKRVDVQLDRSHVLGLKVIDAETKQPIPNARVHFCTEGGIHLRSALYSRQKAEEDAKLAKAGVRRSASGFVPIQSDANGLIHLDRIQAGQYGVWFIAAGYGARWVSPLPSAPRAESAPPHAISLERTGTLRLKPAPDLLAGVKSPYLAYRIWDSEGRVVCADQEPERYQPPYDTALVKLTDKTATGYAVDILPPGTYTLAWELYRVPSSRAFASDLGLPLFKGKARFEVRRGEQSVVELKGERVSQ
ncbi:MAG: carboxypeptidase regulatory-like domain-containing protein, partial [Planctomycetes bacterium]|nr:carboxypeptidase regulatory-like domain-containing protein [Planctomycetota bacterium]